MLRAFQEKEVIDSVSRLRSELDAADAVVIGAGAGLSASAGFAYTGGRFEKYFGDFASRYHFNDMYSGGFYPYGTLEEYWAWWSRQIMLNRYEAGVGANTPGMADDMPQSESSIRLHQPGGSLCAKGDRRSGNLHGRGYWRSIKKIRMRGSRFNASLLPRHICASCY